MRSLRVSESQIQAGIVRMAEALGWYCFHCVDCRRGPKTGAGYPDLTLVRDGRVLWVEVKTEQGVVSEAQKRWHRRLVAAGGTVHIWRPKHWPDAIQRALT